MTADTLDRRRVIVEIELENERKRYEGLSVKYTISKPAGQQMNEASIDIANIAKADRDYLVAATSPFKREKERKTITLYAGYESTGVRRLFKGDITSATVTQPPDIWLQMKAKTGFFSRNTIVSVSSKGKEMLSAIAARVAESMELTLDFQAEDKLIENYSFTGGAALQVDKLAQAGTVNVFVDDDMLVIKPAGVPLRDKLCKINKNTGMLGLPQLTEGGLTLSMLHNSDIALGGEIEVESEINPVANGRYTVATLTYTGESHGAPFKVAVVAQQQDVRTWTL